MLTKCGQIGLYEMIENEIIDTLDLNLFSCKMKRICSEPTLNIHVNRFDKGTLAEESVVIASNGQIVSLNTESETCIGKDLVHISTGKTIEGKISDILTESKNQSGKTW